VPTYWTQHSDGAARWAQSKLFSPEEADGLVGPRTIQALSGALLAIRGEAPKPSTDRVEPVLPGKNWLLLTRTHKKTYADLELCKLRWIGGAGEVLASMDVISGSPGNQTFGGPDKSRAGDGAPIPQGRYGISDADWAGGKDNYSVSWEIAGNGLGPVKYWLKKMQIDDRDAFQIHCDWNWVMFGHSAGSAGCVCPFTVPELKRLVSLMRQFDPSVLVVDWTL
jgi:lysozyme